MRDFVLPSLGADMDDGVLVEWTVKPGQVVKKGDIVAVVDTNKAAVEIQCWHDGVVHELLGKPHERIKVGTVIATMLDPGEAAPPAKAARPVEPGPVAAVRASPAARRRAEELHVDLSRVTGTGPGGALAMSDVEAAAASSTPPAPPTPDERAANMRAAVAALMSRSKREIPHYYLETDIPLAHAQEWLARANEGRSVENMLAVPALLMKAVARAARRFHDFNGTCVDGVFVHAPRVNVGVVVSLRLGGVVAPAILDADELSPDALMAALVDVVKRARASRLRSSEMTEATLTVTNLGDQGVERVLGVIFPPQVALVGFGRVTVRPWVVDGAVKPVPVVTASLAADHRVSDGHRGGLFLSEVRRLLQEPAELAGGGTP